MQTDQSPELPPPHEHNPHSISAQYGLPRDQSIMRRMWQNLRTQGPEEGDGIYRGAIQGIKLTGDPNVPRGQHTFIADNIGPSGLVRIADEEPFKGARIVHCRGHVAEENFQHGKPP